MSEYTPTQRLPHGLIKYRWSEDLANILDPHHWPPQNSFARTSCEEVGSRTSQPPTTSQHHVLAWICPHNYISARATRNTRHIWHACNYNVSQKKMFCVISSDFRFEAIDRSLSPIDRLKGSGEIFFFDRLAVSMRSNFQFHVISRIDIGLFC